ncbi:type IV secretory system conjugative DNA transfer family protein [Actinacidiphila sp. bgisy145]|uniref:type IV secretory system conjugative DNA transfer family protein n=1 Tax=Actinacidiphila sp. bgisy145 TaxID=3413792 RepID=UPI003EC043F7
MAARKKESTGGLPDGLIVGIIGLLLGVTLLVWTATGIAAVLAHGSWPQGVRFTRTPHAMRFLVTQPHDMATAWPQVPRGQLPGAQLFWWVLAAQIALLVVFVVWLLNTVARLRGKRPPRTRTPRRAARTPDPAQEASGYDAEDAEDAAAYEAEDEYDGDDGDALAPGKQGGQDGASPAEVPAPRRRTAPPSYARGGDESLDAWFRTVPRAVPPGPPGTPAAEDAPTTQIPPVHAEGLVPTGAATAAAGPAPGPAATAPLTALADGEITRTYALFAAPRGDKAKQVVQPAVLAAAGPVVVTTADPDTYHQTAGNRAKLGPVHVFDPAHLVDVPGRLRWAPHGGCERPDTARTRAAALLAPLRTARADEAIVHDAAVTLLRCWLHAAAVDGRPFRQVQRWSAGGSSAGEAVRVLRSDRAAASGWSGELESVLHAHPERRDAAQALIRRALEPLNSVHIRDACTPAKSGGLDLESFTAERGTLYVVGERIEDPRSHPGAMPLLTALVSSVVEHGRRMAGRSPAGRLDPPMTFVLDDVAALAPVPELPVLLAEGRAAGLPTLAVLRSPEQGTARWRSPLWQQADMRLALGDATAEALPPTVPDAVRIH